MQKIVEDAKEHPGEQIVGVLLGGQSDGTVVIEDAVTGPAESNPTSATLTGDSIAKIADDMVKKRIRGSIVGWYHSHVRGGVFMSETDVETQLKLQQFSPLVTAMVVDAQTGEFGFFRADSKTRGAISVASREVGTEAAPLVAGPSGNGSAVFPQVYAPPPAAPIPTRTILIAVVLITLAVTGGIVALAYYRGPTFYGGSLAIAHTPPSSTLSIGNAITIDANVTGSNLQSVTLAYRIIDEAPRGGRAMLGNMVRVPMLLNVAGCTGTCTYSYTVPPSEVSGLYMEYYVSASDTSSPPNVVRTDLYTLQIGTYDWHDVTTEATAIRTVQTTVSLALDSIHGFTEPVTIQITTSPPLGVRIAPASTQVRPPNPAVLTITSTDNAQIASDYEVEVDAVYILHGVQIIRPTTLKLTVTDFDLSLSPSYQTAIRCTDTCAKEDAVYILKMNVYNGFTCPNGFKFSVTGLPDHTSWQLIFVDDRISLGQTETLTYEFKVHAEQNAYAATYLITMTIYTDAVSHSTSNIQLQITD